MDQEQSHTIEIKPQVENVMGEEVEEGEVVEIKEKVEKIKVGKSHRHEIDGSDSEWSWDSIEDLKGIDLKKLQAEEDENGGGKMESEHKVKEKIKVVYPEKPTNIQNLTAKYVGNIIQLVGDLLIVQADLKSTYEVVDLDGWICDENKNFIGFVIDVFGKIETPFYAIKPEENLKELETFIGKQIYYIEGTKILNEDEIKSIQSKNNKEFEIEEESSSSDYEKEDREISMEAPELNRDQKRENIVNNRRHRKSSFDHGDRNQERSRTREQFKNKNNWNARNNNEQYLQQMYAMHYSQMMQFYHPSYQANTATIPNMPPPPFGNPQNFGNPPNFLPGNMPNFMPGNQPPRQNAFIPPQNNFQNPPNNQNQNDNRFARR